MCIRDRLNIVRREAGAFNDAGGGGFHARDGMAESLIAAHGPGGQAFMGVFRGGGAAGAAARNLEQVMQGACLLYTSRENAARSFRRVLFPPICIPASNPYPAVYCPFSMG